MHYLFKELSVSSMLEVYFNLNFWLLIAFRKKIERIPGEIGGGSFAC